MRLANIYDVDKKTFLFKFARSPDSAILLIESGIRFHTTEFEWPKNPSPSAFAMKVGCLVLCCLVLSLEPLALVVYPNCIVWSHVFDVVLSVAQLRKHVRTRRLTGLLQYGSDRVIDLVLGSGEATYHIIVELYDKV